MTVTPQPITAFCVWHARRAHLQDRYDTIMRVFEDADRPGYTDRGVCELLGYPDMNYVRPYITRLVQRGLLHVVDHTVDPHTNRRVRIVGLPCTSPLPQETV